MFQMFFLLFPFVRNMRMTIPIFIASFCSKSVITCSKYSFSITKFSLNVYKFFLRFLFLSYLKSNVANFLLLFLFKIILSNYYFTRNMIKSLPIPLNIWFNLHCFELFRRLCRYMFSKRLLYTPFFWVHDKYISNVTFYR